MDRRIARRSKKPVYVGAGAAAVVVLALVWFLTDGTSTSFTLDGQRIRTAEVSVGMYEDYIPLRASVEPERTVYLDAIEGGRVEEVLVASLLRRTRQLTAEHLGDRMVVVQEE